VSRLTGLGRRLLAGAQSTAARMLFGAVAVGLAIWFVASRWNQVVDALARMQGRWLLLAVLATVANLLLTERFRDQVNVVRASWPGGSATLLFTQGDNGKAIR